MKTRFLLSGVFLAGTIVLRAVPLTESTFTEIVKDVNVVAQTTKAATPAKVKEVVKAPNLVRTGPESRAELTAPDQTLTRIGANTVFSFDTTGRQIDLQQGSLLFHSPSGKGGGTIKSGGAAAAVLGTTIIVAATPGGGFKVIVLEGKGQVTINGKTFTLKAGQLIYVLPGQGASKVIDINLDKLVGGSLLVKGFSQPLPSRDLINDAIAKQLDALAKGKATDTGLPPNISTEPPNNGINTIDSNIPTPSRGSQQGRVLPSQGSGEPRPGVGGSVLTGISSTTISGGSLILIDIGQAGLPATTTFTDSFIPPSSLTMVTLNNGSLGGYVDFGAGFRSVSGVTQQMPPSLASQTLPRSASDFSRTQIAPTTFVTPPSASILAH